MKENEKQQVKKPSATDSYKGIKREAIGAILKDKDGKETRIKL